MIAYVPRQPDEHWRVTGRIFNIIIDGFIERVQGGRVDRCNVTVCRYENMDETSHYWNSTTYPHGGQPVTPSTRARLVRVAARAMENRK
jgi:hypothetical protein